MHKPQEFDTWMTKCFLSTNLDPRQQVVLSHCLTEIFGPLLPPLLRLFLPLIQHHSIWEKRQNKMFSFGKTFQNCHTVYPLKLSWTAIKRDRGRQTAGCREWERLLCGRGCTHICSSIKHWKLAAAETGNIHTLRLTAESTEDSQYRYNQLSTTQLTFIQSEPLPALKDWFIHFIVLIILELAQML